jgi:hypothetical protein
MNRPALALVVGLALAGVASAHDARPCYLRLAADGAERCAVVWTRPVVDGAPVDVRLVLPDAWGLDGGIARGAGADAVTERFTVRVGALPLAGATVRFEGAGRAAARVVVDVIRVDGRRLTMPVTGAPWSLEVAAAPSTVAVAAGYTWLGIEHIAFGFDHALFVLGLVLLVPGWGRLAWTVTGFTLAHSVTLACAVLGLWRLPSAPVEIVIALSIVFLAREVLRADAGAPPSIAVRRPWLVAGAFGLLHGFGFAGALAEVGLPDDAVPLALASFNAGVELGQLALVAGALAALAALRRGWASPPTWARAAVPAAMGAVAAGWCLERAAALAG